MLKYAWWQLCRDWSLIHHESGGRLEDALQRVPALAQWRAAALQFRPPWQRAGEGFYRIAKGYQVSAAADGGTGTNASLSQIAEVVTANCTEKNNHHFTWSFLKICFMFKCSNSLNPVCGVDATDWAFWNRSFTTADSGQEPNRSLEGQRKRLYNTEWWPLS